MKMPLTPICSICCDHFTPDCIIKTTKCGHIFHRQCILRWLRNTPSCPECRRYGPVLYRVYLNFSESLEAEETNSMNLTFSDAELQIETLLMKLSLEETTSHNALQRVQELERKLSDQLKIAKTKDEEHKRVIKSLIANADKLHLDNIKKSRQAIEDTEKLLQKEISSIKSKQHKYPTSSINIINRGCNSNTIIKLNSSSAQSNQTDGIRVKSTISSMTSKSTFTCPTAVSSNVQTITPKITTIKPAALRNASSRKITADTRLRCAHLH